jgi:hypothetical protein
VRRLKRKRLVRPALEASRLSRPNQEWAIDFVADSLPTGRGLRRLTVVDSFTRECPAIEETRDCRAGESRACWTGSSGRGEHRKRFVATTGRSSRVVTFWPGPKNEECGDPHSAGAADAERTCGKFQRADPRRVSESPLVHHVGGCQGKDREVASGIQCRAAAQQPGSRGVKLDGSLNYFWC